MAPRRCVVCSNSLKMSGAADDESPVHFSLQCGHWICRACLAQGARSSLSSRLVPLRCCMMSIPTESISVVLDPEEIAYYSYLLRKANAASEAVAEPTTTKRSSGKKKLSRKFASERVVDLTNGQEDTQREPGTCHSCLSEITSPRVQFTAPCGHLLCRNCLIQRCRHSISNDKDPGGIGVPVRCCGKVLPLEFVQAAVTKRDFTKYSDLFAKFEASRQRFPRTPATARSQKRKAREDDAQNGGFQESKQSAVQAKPISAHDIEPENCISCMAATVANECVKGPCGHTYCLSCLGYMAKMSVNNRALVPIRCCGSEFPEEFVTRVLSVRDMKLYRRFVAEKSPHESTLKSDKEYAALVLQVQGKQCPKCGVGVQRVDGCSMMTCPLGHRFCWNCGLDRCACV